MGSAVRPATRRVAERERGDAHRAARNSTCTPTTQPRCRGRVRARRVWQCRSERLVNEPSSALISSSQGAAGAHWPRLGAVRGDVAGRPGVRGGLSVDALSWEVLLNWASCCMCSCAASRSERCVRAGQSATGGHGDGGARDSRRGDDLVAHRRRSSGAGNERPVQRSACREKISREAGAHVDGVS